MAEWLGNGLQNHAQQFDSAWHLYLLVISFSVINYVVSMRGPHVSGDNLFFLCLPISCNEVMVHEIFGEGLYSWSGRGCVSPEEYVPSDVVPVVLERESPAESLQFFVHPVYRQPHDGVEGAFDGSDADVADPFLDAVGSCLVVGTVFLYVIGYFLIAERLEMHGGGVAEGDFTLQVTDGHGGDDLVALSRKVFQHSCCFLPAVRLAHDFVFAKDKGVGGNQNLVFGERSVKAVGLALR